VVAFTGKTKVAVISGRSTPSDRDWFRGRDELGMLIYADIVATLALVVFLSSTTPGLAA
jgi:hypothetical protein